MSPLQSKTQVSPAVTTADVTLARKLLNAAGRGVDAAFRSLTVDTLLVRSKATVGSLAITKPGGLSISGAVVMPAGAVSLFGGTTAPTGWLLCDGSAVSRTTFAALFTAISTNFGAGNGSTTFNVPDLRGRVVVGTGQGSSLTNRVIGASGGAETVTLSTANMAPHTHGTVLGQHQHTMGNHSHAHAHTPSGGGQYLASGTPSANVQIGATNYRLVGETTDSTGPTPNITDGASTFPTQTSDNGTGSDTAFGIMDPFQVVTYIIKT